MIKPKTTTRLFYGKWLYKSSFNFYRAAFVRNFTKVTWPSELDRFNVPLATLANLLDLGVILEKYPQDQWGKRIENSTVDIYTSNPILQEEIELRFVNCLKQSFRPVANIKAYNSSEILVSKYPHNIYQYKVYLLPHKMDMDLSVRQSFVNWCDTRSPKIKMTSSVKRWFYTTNWNWDRRYILVEDEATLLLLKLRGADTIGRIYKYVIHDK